VRQAMLAMAMAPHFLAFANALNRARIIPACRLLLNAPARLARGC